jgi:hypothetical protein
MTSWALPQISDYWDSRTNSVFVMAQRLEAIDRSDRQPVLREITLGVERCLDELDSSDLQTFAWIMADDLYRTACNLSYWDESLPDYLRASVRPFLSRLTRVGHALRYFVDNEFDTTPVGLALPAQWAPLWFTAAGFSYISPQAIAYQRIQTDRRQADQWTDMLPSYLPLARRSAMDALRRCGVLGGHLVFIDAESREDAGHLAFEQLAPGAIIAFRNLAPHLSSSCIVKIVPLSA